MPDLSPQGEYVVLDGDPVWREWWDAKLKAAQERVKSSDAKKVQSDDQGHGRGARDRAQGDRQGE